MIFRAFRIFKWYGKEIVVYVSMYKENGSEPQRQTGEMKLQTQPNKDLLHSTIFIFEILSFTHYTQYIYARL